MDGVTDIGTVVDALTEFVRTAQPGISGPSDIKYGVKWEPTVSYWRGTRRVHLWLKEDPTPAVQGAETVLVVEVADVGADGNRTVQRCHVSSVEEARSIMQRFLCERCAISQLTGHEWIRDPLQHDKSIPHPPDSPKMGNLAHLSSGNTVPTSGSTPSQIVPVLGSAPSQAGGFLLPLDILLIVGGILWLLLALLLG